MEGPFSVEHCTLATDWYVHWALCYKLNAANLPPEGAKGLWSHFQSFLNLSCLLQYGEWGRVEVVIAVVISWCCKLWYGEWGQVGGCLSCCSSEVSCSMESDFGWGGPQAIVIVFVSHTLSCYKTNDFTGTMQNSSSWGMQMEVSKRSE